MTYMVWRGAAAAAYNIYKAFAGKVFNDMCSIFRLLVILPKGIGQSGVGIAAYMAGCYVRQLFYIRTHLLTTQGAVETDGEGLCMHYRNIESFQCLAAQGSARSVRNSTGDHNRQLRLAALTEVLFNSVDSRFTVQRIKDGLYQEDVNTAFYQAFYLLCVRFRYFVEGNGAIPGIVHIRRKRQGLIQRADSACHKTGLIRVLGSVFRSSFFRDTGSSHVQFVGQVLHIVIRHGDGGAAEGIGFNNIGA